SYKAERCKLACYRSTNGGIVGQRLSADAQKFDSATRTTALHLCFCWRIVCFTCLLGFRTESLADTWNSHGGRSRTRDRYRLKYSHCPRSRTESGGYLSPRRHREIRRAQRNRPADQAAAGNGLDH